MINAITIKNFRCYGDSTIEGFKRINLIGGLNNSGKTVLLEAILLNCSPTTSNIATLKQLRGDDLDTKDLPEYTWDNFFINQDKSKNIYISTNHDDNKDVILIMNCNDEADDFKQSDEKNDDENDTQIIVNDFVANEKAIKSVLHLKYKIDNKDIPVLTAMAHKKGITIKEFKLSTAIASYIPASTRRKSAILAKEYGIIEKRGKENTILEALKIVDKDIEAIRVSVVGGVHLEVRKKQGNFMPISLYGDAVNKILNITLTLVNNNGTILLIDEIENGIHYTIQRDFWNFLFALASKDFFDVQIFATTHSFEMMDTFVKAANSSECAYFELYRRELTGEIDYNMHNIETLSFELANKLAVRGE
jgi:AAA15 family ATPase/GTPase